jgi:hypothetical protein
VAFPNFAESWTLVLASFPLITMTVGNLLTLQQTNIKRLLAYSSIAHAGLCNDRCGRLSQLGAASVVFYLGAYIATNLLAFGIVMAFNRVTGLDDIKDYCRFEQALAPAWTDDARGVPVAGRDAPVRWFCGKGFRLCRRRAGELRLAGHRGHRQLDYRRVLLPERAEVCVSVPHAGEDEEKASRAA